MVINIDKLKEAGVAVRIFERNGKGTHSELSVAKGTFIEVFFEAGAPLAQGIKDGVKQMVQSKVYATALTDNIAQRIHEIQIMEAIASTEDE